MIIVNYLSRFLAYTIYDIDVNYLYLGEVRMNKLILTVKEASFISDLPTTYIRKQVENGGIPHAYFVQHKQRKTYIIYRQPFMNWLNEIRGDACE